MQNNSPNTKQKKKKKTKKQLTVRLALYLIGIAAVIIAFLVYVRTAPPAEKQTQTESVPEAVVTEAPPRETTPVPTPTPFPEEPPLTVEEQVANCFKAFDSLTGEEEFESLGGYEAPEEQIYQIRKWIKDFQFHGYTLGFIMIDIPTGKGIAYNPKQEYYSASSVKGPYMVSLIANEKDVLKEWGDIIEEIAHTSDNGCYSMLFRNFGEEYYNAWCDEAQASAYMYNGYNYTYYSPEGLARLWMLNYKFFTTDPDMGETAGELFENPEYSLIHKTLYPIYKTRSKSGWINIGESSAIDSGIIYAGDHPYLLTVLSDFGGDIEKFTPLVYQIERIHQDIIAEDSLSVSKEVRGKLQEEETQETQETQEA